MFRKVLVANRGEIAVRIIRGLREMGIRSVAVYSDADRAALHVRMADEAAHIGASSSSESYLRMDRVLEAAQRHGAEAIHPGYGFLSENGEFAEACEDAGLVFVGPSAASIRAMGSKTSARKVAKEANAPIVPGTEDAVQNADDARRIAAEIGYPVLLKAAAGGGGKGMRKVASEPELEAALRDAASEAERSFKNSEIYIEKLIERPRHIEIQVAGDRFGNMIHLGERECSIQRRHQKVIEECPSPLVALHPEMRAEMGETSVRIAKAAGYYNVGTMEFLVDEDRRFYFLEMNTRLQVEHPVTELVTGLDLVRMQLRIAAGEPLGLSQADIAWRGSALECRIYAEDPNNNFYPSPGVLTELARPTGPGIRLDTGVYAGWEVPIDYDPLLAKLAVWAEDRPGAIARMKRALGEYYVAGIKTNVTFFRQILEDPDFVEARLHTSFIEEFFTRTPGPPTNGEPDHDALAALAAALHTIQQRTDPQLSNGAESRWLSKGRERAMR